MRIALLLLTIFPRCLWATEADQIGSILERSPYTGPDVLSEIEYIYSENHTLTLVYGNISMNAAVKQVGGSLLREGSTIKITPKEIYGPRGPVESTALYSIRYVIPQLKPGLYKVTHDDSETEGLDRIITVDLDLRSPGTKKYSIKPEKKQIEPDR